jgi:hypothetical protein
MTAPLQIPLSVAPNPSGDKTDFRLPRGYVTRSVAVPYNDIPGSFVYQPHVYELANYLATKANLKYIVDIGCGSGEKLVSMHKRFSILGIDSPFGISMARQSLPEADLKEYDLETGLPEIPAAILRETVIICSDVVEHLKNPMPLILALTHLAAIAPYVLISTPDRDRARGWLDDGPPANTAHVMEWSGPEFVRLLLDAGFGAIPFHGHTINTSIHRAKITSLALCGTHAQINKSVSQKKVAAIIHGFNDADMLSEAVHHLAGQQVEVHYFDNWSTDGSWDVAVRLREDGLIRHCERFPDQPGSQYEWHNQLQKTSSYAAALDADWVMHYDVDEIRVSPWADATLAEAISHIDALGFNAIDFTVLDFRFTKDRPDCVGPFQTALTHFEFGRRPGHFAQVKCWKNIEGVDIASSGGHNAEFHGRKVFPVKFLMKHYPLRNREQANQKVFRHRLPRFDTEKKRHGWHTQYDHFVSHGSIDGWSCQDLIPWHQVYFNTEYFVERISGIGLV